jgi:hypothetical protein
MLERKASQDEFLSVQHVRVGGLCSGVWVGGWCGGVLLFGVPVGSLIAAV